MSVKKYIGRVSTRIENSYHKSPVAYWLILALGLSFVFALRNISTFTLANFYAEDATVLFENIYTKDVFHTLLSAFNGYLIVGQYLLAYIAAGINLLIGNNLESLPIVTAAVSCAFLGMVASLPFLLFREQLGPRLAVLTGLLTALVPLKSYDYAIIGTISNLKFVFLYVAALLVIYRLVNKGMSIRKALIIDSLLLLCALTNATVAFLLPLVLLTYVPYWTKAIKNSRWKLVNVDAQQISAVILVTLAVLYTAVAVLKGIPKIPGYLEGPFDWHSTLVLADRSLSFALLYPITASFNNYFVAALLGVIFLGGVWLFWKRKGDRYIIAVSFWAIFLGTVLFAINRPGIGALYLTYGHKGGPDQFFFAQNMIFIFLLAWVIRGVVKYFKLWHYLWASVFVVLYLLLALPHGSSFGESRIVYQQMGPIGPNVEKACAQYANEDKVILQIYPTTYWQWRVDTDFACR